MDLRVSFLVDGLNVYHSLCEIERVSKARVRWLDLRKLCLSYLHAVRGAMDQRVALGTIEYFSALALHRVAYDPGSVDAQNAYFSVLAESGVTLTVSRFKQKDATCPGCGMRFVRYEEKETDVAIGMRMMELAARGECQVIVLVSGDTDMIPAVKAAKRLSPSVAVGVAFPFLRHNAELRAVADFTFGIGQRNVQRAQFPPAVSLADGRTIVKPIRW